MSNLTQTTIGSLIEFQRGYDLPQSSFKSGTVPVISSNGILGYHNESKVAGPGITIGRSGTVGLPHYIQENFFPHNTSLFVRDFKGNDPKYIFYLLKTLGLNNKKSGSGVPTMNRNHLHPLKILAYLDTATQKKVATILSTLDAKIELNNRINTELEAMAKTLYDYWFVQFDFPDANGKPYKTSGGKMVYNDMLKREIPDGWDVKTVSDLIEVRDGTHDSPKKSDSGHYLITSKHLKKSGLDFQEAYLISDEDFEAVNKRSQVHEGDFLISMIGTVGLTHWVMKISTPFAIKNIGLFKTSQSPRLADYIYSAVNSDFGKTYLEQHLSTGTSQPYVTLGTLRQIPIVIPKDNVLNLFLDCVKPIHQKIYLKTTESQQLTQLRDWLLPMLMNDQVRVN